MTILDLTVLAQHFLKPVTPATARYNQDADNAISILDLTKMANLFLQNRQRLPVGLEAGSPHLTPAFGHPSSRRGEGLTTAI